LGNHNIEDIKNHTIFEKFNWKKIEKQEIKAPYFPETTKIDIECKKTYKEYCTII